MKIGVDIRVLMDKYYSGVSQYTANLLSAIFELDKTSDYKLFYNSWNNLDLKLSAWNHDNSKVIGLHIPNKIFNYLFQKILMRPKIDLALGGVDVFWSPHFNFTSLSEKTKKVITVHDLSFLRYPEFFSVRKNFWHKALNIKKTLENSDVIIAVSENTKNDIVELLNIESAKIKVIYSGNNIPVEADLNITKTDLKIKAQADFINKNNLKGRLILYLGTIEPRKNIAALIEAYNELRIKNESFSDLKLVLAGACGWKNKKIYKKWNESPYKQDIIFLGYISQFERDILYRQSLVFVYPSFYEGFGFPPLEAMSQGLPVICSNVSSLPEVVGSAALMINPFKSTEITEALETIINDETFREMLIKKGYERSKLFTWEKTAKEYLEVFKSLK